MILVKYFAHSSDRDNSYHWRVSGTVNKDSYPRYNIYAKQLKISNFITVPPSPIGLNADSYLYQV